MRRPLASCGWGHGLEHLPRPLLPLEWEWGCQREQGGVGGGDSSDPTTASRCSRPWFGAVPALVSGSNEPSGTWSPAAVGGDRECSLDRQPAPETQTAPPPGRSWSLAPTSPSPLAGLDGQRVCAAAQGTLWLRGHCLPGRTAAVWRGRYSQRKPRSLPPSRSTVRAGFRVAAIGGDPVSWAGPSSLPPSLGGGGSHLRVHRGTPPLTTLGPRTQGWSGRSDDD